MVKNFVKKISVLIETGSHAGASNRDPATRVWLNIGGREYRLKRHNAFLPFQEDIFVIPKQNAEAILSDEFPIGDHDKQTPYPTDVQDDNLADVPTREPLDSLLSADYLIYLGYWGADVWSINRIYVEIEDENGTRKGFGKFNANGNSTRKEKFKTEFEMGGTYGAYLYLNILEDDD